MTFIDVLFHARYCLFFVDSFGVLVRFGLQSRLLSNDLFWTPFLNARTIEIGTRHRKNRSKTQIYTRKCLKEKAQYKQQLRMLHSFGYQGYMWLNMDKL